MTMQQRLREETERERTPWEVANEPYGTERSWDYTYRNDEYHQKTDLYDRVSDVYA